VLRLVMALLKTDAIDCQFTSGKCARAWGRYGDRKEAAGSPGGVRFELKCPQVPAAPARNFVSLAAISEGKGKGKGGGDPGPFIGAARAGNRQGVMRIEEGGVTGGRLGLRRRFRSREEEDLTGGSGLTGGVHASVREGERWIPFR
jgi:hypothetical protein